MALGNIASQNEATRKRIIKDANTIQVKLVSLPILLLLLLLIIFLLMLILLLAQLIENYMFEDHELIRRAAVQCWTNLCVSQHQVSTTQTS